MEAEQVEVPEDIVERVHRLCLALPEVTERVDFSHVRTRSTAWSFDIRRRSFCLLVASVDTTGKPDTILVLRAEPEERDALLAGGHPYYTSPAGEDRIVVVIIDDTDWDEIAEFLTDSYRTLAPKKLVALLDQHTTVGRPRGPVSDSPAGMVPVQRLPGVRPVGGPSRLITGHLTPPAERPGGRSVAGTGSLPREGHVRSGLRPSDRGPF